MLDKVGTRGRIVLGAGALYLILLLAVVAYTAKNLDAGFEILRFAQDDNRFAQDDTDAVSQDDTNACHSEGAQRVLSVAKEESA